MMRLQVLPVVLVVVALVGGCSGSADSAEPPDDATTVVGTAECTVPSRESSVIDGVEVIEERFVCELDFSDPRVTGTETLDVTVRMADSSVGGTWTAPGHIVTDSGEWRGTGQGAFSMVDVLPHAENIRPANFGEMRYEGEGDLEGLVFVYYFAGSNATEGLAGWIAEG